jgi:hypothetical protein
MQNVFAAGRRFRPDAKYLGPTEIVSAARKRFRVGRKKNRTDEKGFGCTEMVLTERKMFSPGRQYQSATNSSSARWATSPFTTIVDFRV